MNQDDTKHGAEVRPPAEPAKVEVKEVNEDLSYDKGAKLDSAALHQSEVNAPGHSEVIEPKADD
ncbi:hypothetical protein OVA24_17690 [Luteolibacter sp. SL250]|uniref:hypothetical protein n=1 Tax=Luteolibacter sp. SL250 TaxID=2995170 RepID=UPI002270AA59|nr:hypothetical protein [Luteolibacter sp. SL250]WAC19062.1 hypothetical protein OVA24_17690 [Luteolibacter sp. SL250]